MARNDIEMSLEKIRVECEKIGDEKMTKGIVKECDKLEKKVAPKRAQTRGDPVVRLMD